jgi:enoyl-CoA hydratase/carnithine racemase
MSPETEEHGVRVERDGPVATWIIDRPNRRNALARPTVRRLGQLAREASHDPELRAVVITGAGDQAFSAGADLKERQSMDQEDVRDFLGLYRASFGYIDSLGVPVVAALNGSAFGGGLELALACDLRVMTPEAQIGLTEVSLGIIPGAGGTQRLTRLVGPAKAKELIVLARRIDAEEALSLGLVNRVAHGQDVVQCARELLQPVENGAPIALGAALEAIDAAGEMPLDAGLLHERKCYERTLESEDRLEALAAFREKRKPRFKGQ